jgi:Ca2+-dependent lipid-binding protein
MGVLTIVLDKVTNLRDRDGVGQSDPYVKFHLYQDKIGFNKNYGNKQSSIKGGTLDPVYNETFVFHDVSLNNLKLSVRIMDSDVGLDDRIGLCDLDLEKEDLNGNLKNIEAVTGKKSIIYLKMKFEE